MRIFCYIFNIKTRNELMFIFYMDKKELCIQIPDSRSQYYCQEFEYIILVVVVYNKNNNKNNNNNTSQRLVSSTIMAIETVMKCIQFLSP